MADAAGLSGSLGSVTWHPEVEHPTVKTIVHVVLSNSERNDLARRLARKDTRHLVSRNEVTELVHALIDQELKDGRDDQPEPDSIPDEPTEEADTEQPDDVAAECIPELVPDASTTLPDATELKKACASAIEHIDRHFDDELYPLNIGWCCSILVATGVR